MAAGYGIEQADVGASALQLRPSGGIEDLMDGAVPIDDVRGSHHPPHAVLGLVLHPPLERRERGAPHGLMERNAGLVGNRGEELTFRHSEATVDSGCHGGSPVVTGLTADAAGRWG